MSQPQRPSNRDFSHEGVSLISASLPKPSASVFEDLFEHAPCGYLVLDASGTTEKVNATLLGWLGYTAEEALDRHLTDFLPVTGRIAFETHLMPLLRLQGFCHEIAFDLRKKDGSKLPVMISASEARDGGAVAYIKVTVFQAVQRQQFERGLVAARDAADAAQSNLSEQNASLRTNIKRAVGEKRRAQRGLLAEQETGELREQFVAVLGHDLRNPLASISSAARILAREQKSERATQVLQLMEGSVRRMSGLIDNVLDFARGRLGGGIGLNRTTTEPLEPTLRQVVEELKAGAIDRQIDVQFDLEAPVFCDPGRMGQLLSNLLGNALSHGAPDRAIQVEARATVEGDLTISVVNAGEAITPEAMERLFEPFVRGQGRGYQQGLGLGLHIASEIAKAHGATLTVTSSDVETMFTFFLPGEAAKPS